MAAPTGSTGSTGSTGARSTGLRSNPLIALEVMRRFRSPMAAWAIPLLLILPGVAVCLIYAATTSWGTSFDPMGNPMAAGAFDVEELSGMGVGMFSAVAGLLLLTLILTVPTLVGPSIAGERHNQTLQPLQLTEMTPSSIVAGKLISSVAYLVVVLLCASPVMVIPFLLGGITAMQVVGTFIVLVLIMIEFAAISLAASATLSKPTGATFTALVSCAVVTVAPWIVMGVLYAVAYRSNPALDAEDSAIRLIASLSPVSLGSWVVDSSNDLTGIEAVETVDKVASVVSFLVITSLSLLLARSKVTAPVERDR